MTISTEHFVHIGPADPSPTTPLPPTERLGAPAPAPTTTHLPPLSWRDELALAWRIWRDRLARSWPALLAGAVIALALVGLWLVREPVPMGARAQALPAPTPPLVVPTAPPAGPALPVALVAYDAPAGATLGELPAGQPYLVLAQAHGGAWLQLDAGSGPVWVEAAAWGNAPIVRAAALDDLTPPTPVPPPPTPPPAQVIYVQAPAPVAPPAPQPTEAPGWHPPMASGYDPNTAAAAPPDCPLVLAPAQLEACLAGQP